MNENIRDLHFLVVDDSPAMVGLLTAYLKSMGARRISRATGVVEARGVLASSEQAIDCVVCDFSMPDGTGLDLLGAIRSGSAGRIGPDACFILVTASEEADTRDIAARLSVNGYLTKPVKPEELRRVIVEGFAELLTA